MNSEKPTLVMASILTCLILFIYYLFVCLFHWLVLVACLLDLVCNLDCPGTHGNPISEYHSSAEIAGESHRACRLLFLLV